MHTHVESVSSATILSSLSLMNHISNPIKQLSQGAYELMRTYATIKYISLVTKVLCGTPIYCSHLSLKHHGDLNSVKYKRIC